MKTIKFIILLYFSCSALYSQSDRIGFTMGGESTLDSNMVDSLSLKVSAANFSKIFSKSYNLTVYSPTDSLVIRTGNDLSFSGSGRNIPVLPGVPLVIKNLDPLYNKYVGVKKRSETAGGIIYYWSIGGE